MKTMKQLLEEGKSVLEQAGVPDALLDARYLLLETFQMPFSTFLAKQSFPLPETEETAEQCACYEERIAKRASRIPLQYLIGNQEFMGLTFAVSEAVLIPRQDTETLVEEVLKDWKSKDISLLDVCTGSGCIAISLACLGGYRKVTALDISKDALAVARENASLLLDGYDGAFTLLESDMFSEIGEEERFDVIVSNPPYIPSAEIETLEPEVRTFEPRQALDGEADGLTFYRILAKECGKHLNVGGMVYFEIGWDQAKAVTALLKENGFEKIAVIQDMAGHDRVVRAVFKNGPTSSVQSLPEENSV